MKSRLGKELFFGIFFGLCFLAGPLATADEKIKMYFKNEELLKIIEVYSKHSGQKFVIDPVVRGKISILIQEPITVEESFNHLSTALALNGFAISKQGDTMVIQSARNIQRSLIEVGTEKPSLKPERLYIWAYKLKFASAPTVNRDIRMLLSKDGELVVHESTNQLLITDWVSNLARVGEILKQVDVEVTPRVTK